jgi:hypothetical protein
MLVIAKSATPDLDALTACVKAGRPGPGAGGPNSMCNSGWTYPILRRYVSGAATSQQQLTPDER